MLTIGFIQQKGGVMKTLSSTHMASWLAVTRPGSRVLLIDADAQGNAVQWWNGRGDLAGFDAISKPINNLHEEFSALSAGYDFVVIDGPANVSQVNGSAVLCCDIVIVPVKPAGFDVWSSLETIKIIEGLQGDSKRKAFFMMTQKINNTSIGKEVFKALAEMSIPALASVIENRVIWAEAASQSRTVFEIDPKSPAVKEIVAAFTEIMERAA